MMESMTPSPRTKLRRIAAISNISDSCPFLMPAKVMLTIRKSVLDRSNREMSRLSSS